jgi:ABC-type branched-subunit amino acid transport system substrate-binding protein
MSFALSIFFIFALNIPYFDFSDAGSEFYGHGRELGEPPVRTVRIGVMGPEKTPEGEQLRNGVEIALEEANEKGGYRGIPYEMVFRPDDGPWGTASKQVVRLAYDDKVWTIIGGLDGHHTHLAELVVAKAWVPVVTPCAVDFTIDYANVPWVFRCMPDDSRQAELLLELARRRGYRRIVVLTEIGREAYVGFSRLREISWHKRYPLSLHLQYPSYDPELILPRLEGIPIDAVIIWGKGSSAIRLLQALRKRGITVPVLGSSSLATPEVARSAPPVGELIVVAPCDLSRDDAEFLNFKRKFKERTGKAPSPIALFAYDAARLVIRAIEKAGLNRARIRDELAGTSFSGVTGRISFDSLGGNRSEPILMSLKEGRWVRLRTNKSSEGGR